MIGAIVLAAGASRRFGTQKMVAPLAGRPLVRWTVEHALASCVDEVVVVLGHEPDTVRRALAGLPVRHVTNARYGDGMSTSLRAGVAALGGAVRAAVIVLGDQPFADPAVIDALVARYRQTGKPIVVPRYRGVRGNPVLFDAALFPELEGVRGDQGARAVITLDPARVATVDLDTPMPAGVNDAADLEALEQTVALLGGQPHS